MNHEQATRLDYEATARQLMFPFRSAFTHNLQSGGINPTEPGLTLGTRNIAQLPKTYSPRRNCKYLRPPIGYVYRTEFLCNPTVVIRETLQYQDSSPARPWAAPVEEFQTGFDRQGVTKTAGLLQRQPHQGTTKHHQPRLLTSKLGCVAVEDVFPTALSRHR